MRGDGATTNVAIGVLARAPVAGRCKTRLARDVGGERAARLYEAMLRDVLDAFARVGAARRVLFAAPEDDGVARLRAIAPPAWEIEAQAGRDLGARLSHAMRALGAGGHATLLAGSDAPLFDVAALRDALARFDGPRRALLGPSHDGGYWAIGCTAIETRLFDDIAWSTPSVLGATRARCDALGLARTELPAARDVDDARDLAAIARELARDPSRAPRLAAALDET